MTDIEDMTARSVLAMMADYDGPGGSWPSIPILAADLGISSRTVNRAISTLVKAGRLKREKDQRSSRNVIAYDASFCYANRWRSTNGDSVTPTGGVAENPATPPGDSATPTGGAQTGFEHENQNARERAAAPMGAATRAKATRQEDEAMANYGGITRNPDRTHEDAAELLYAEAWKLGVGLDDRGLWKPIDQVRREVDTAKMKEADNRRSR